MWDLAISIIILCASIKRQSKQDPTIYFLKNWNTKDTNRLKVNGLDKEILEYTNLEEAGIAIININQEDFKTTRHFIILGGFIHKTGITIIKVYCS